MRIAISAYTPAVSQLYDHESNILSCQLSIKQVISLQANWYSLVRHKISLMTVSVRNWFDTNKQLGLCKQ